MDELRRDISGEGPHGGILVIGDSPSPEDIKSHKPFSSPLGFVFRNILIRAGATISDVRFEYLVERHVDKQNFAVLYDNGMPNLELRAWHTDIVQRIKKIAPRCIITVGEPAARALLHQPFARISDVHCYAFFHDGIPVIPVFSPGFIFRQPDYEHWVTWGIQKALRFKGMDAGIHCYLAPTEREALDWIESAIKAESISIDIECTIDTHELTTVGIALSPTEVMSIPLVTQGMQPYWSPAVEQKIWKGFIRLLEAPNEKIFQNYIFDTMIFRYNGLDTLGTIYDTLIVSNLLNPELPKSLADLARLYCCCAPWKSVKDWGLSGDPMAFWRYNATDAARTFQIAEKQKDELRARGLHEFYLQYVSPLCRPVLECCTRGIAIDHKALNTLKADLETSLKPIQAILKGMAAPMMPLKKVRKELVRPPFNPSSPKQVKQILSALRYRIPTKDQKETTDRLALLKLHRKKPHPFLEAMLIYGKYAKLNSTYIKAEFDADGRCRFAYNRARDNNNEIGTKSGRFSCAKTPWDTGLNIQTIPRAIPGMPNVKSIFIPDNPEQEDLLQVDLSQAELRVVAWLAGEQKLLNMFENAEDVHQYTADMVSKLTGLNCPRQLGKRLNHAANYGMGAERFSDSCLLEADLSLTVVESQKLLSARTQVFPAIPLWQQEIASEVRRTKRLTTPHGRERYFFGRITDATIREALSYIPQATVVDTINMAWIRLIQDVDNNKFFRVLQQCHDSLLIQVNRNYTKTLVKKLNDILGGLGIIIGGTKRLIPWDFTVGPNWGSLKEVIV